MGAYVEFDGETFFFDVVTNEQVETSSTPTEHNVETGADVSDHIQQNADSVSLSVIVSNTPIADVNGAYGGQYSSLALNPPKVERRIVPTPGGLIQALEGLIEGPTPKDASALVLQWPTKFSATTDAITKLTDWKERGVLGKVITPWRTYPSVVLTRVNAQRSAATGDALEIALDFKTIRTVEAKLVTAPVPTEPRGAAGKRRGAQGLKDAKDPEGKKERLVSVAKSGYNALVNGQLAHPLTVADLFPR